MQERRIFQRFNVDIPVNFRTLDDKKIEGNGKIINISAGGGGLIVTTKNLLPGTSLEMSLIIPDNKAPLNASGKIIWLRDMEPALFLVGIQFDKVDFMGIARALRLHS